MKTGNFPGMRTERRKGALERIENKLEALKGMDDAEVIFKDGGEFVFVGFARRRMYAEAETLRNRINSPAWFTKKHRA